MGAIFFKYEIRRNVLDRSPNLGLKKIFNEWNSIICEYCEYEDFEEALYWYNERTTLSSFAGAIWRTGNLVLEEFSCFKGFEEKGKEKFKRGRADLWFSCGSDYNYICEVKQRWISKNANILSLIKASIGDTEKTKKNFTNSDALAITFWVPLMKVGENIEENIKEIFQRLQGAINNKEIDIFCMVAPDGMQNKKAGDGNYYPCVILVGKFL